MVLGNSIALVQNVRSFFSIGGHLHLTFLFIGFVKQERKKYKLLHRKNNTATLIAHTSPKQKK